MYEHAAKPKVQESKVAQSDYFNKKANNTGIPDAMKTQFENLSGLPFDDVKVHYNSEKPMQLQALAYTQGNQVYVGPGQEKHLGHELGHVVQQKQGRVRPTIRFNGFNINDECSLEKEADLSVGGIAQTKRNGSRAEYRLWETMPDTIQKVDLKINFDEIYREMAGEAMRAGAAKTPDEIKEEIRTNAERRESFEQKLKERQTPTTFGSSSNITDTASEAEKEEVTKRGTEESGGAPEIIMGGATSELYGTFTVDSRQSVIGFAKTGSGLGHSRAFVEYCDAEGRFFNYMIELEADATWLSGREKLMSFFPSSVATEGRLSGGLDGLSGSTSKATRTSSGSKVSPTSGELAGDKVVIYVTPLSKLKPAVGMECISVSRETAQNFIQRAQSYQQKNILYNLLVFQEKKEVMNCTSFLQIITNDANVFTKKIASADRRGGMFGLMLSSLTKILGERSGPLTPDGLLAGVRQEGTHKVTKSIKTD